MKTLFSVIGLVMVYVVLGVFISESKLITSNVGWSTYGLIFGTIGTLIVDR